MDYKDSALEFLGITRWHELGYTGKGIKIMSDEKVCEKVHPDVISPKGFKNKKDHGDIVMSHIKLIAPDAEHIAYPISGMFSNTSYESDAINYIQDNNVDIFTSSYLGGEINGKEKAIMDCPNCLFFIAAGNKGKKGLLGEATSEAYWAIGGVKPSFIGKYDEQGNPIYDWNALTKTSSSSVGEALDFVTVAEILGVPGTSFCSPVKASMIADVQQFFVEQIDRKLDKEEMFEFILRNTTDLNTIGHDPYTGHGILRLPEPKTIELTNYTEIIIPASIDYTGFPQVEEKVEKEAEETMSIAEMFLTPNPYSRPQTKIKPTAIAWHYVGNPNTSAVANRNYFENLKDTHITKASSHFIIGLEGEIIQLIPCNEMSYCTNEANSYTISVECCHPDNSGKFTEATYKSMIWLGRYLMDKYGIKENIRHYDITGKSCPKWFVDNPQEWGKFKNELEGYEMRYKNIEEIPEWARKDVQELMDRGILAGRGTGQGLDLTDDMLRCIILAKRIYETPNHVCNGDTCTFA